MDGSIRIAATARGSYSSAEQFVTRLKREYEPIRFENLPEAFRSGRYDLVLIGSSPVCADESLVERTGGPLRAFVERGGIVWGADWGVLFLRAAFPRVFIGTQVSNADRSDTGFPRQRVRGIVALPRASGLGRDDVTIEFRFDNWYEVTKWQRMTTWIWGDAVTEEGKRVAANLMSYWSSAGGGAVVANAMPWEAISDDFGRKVFHHVLTLGPQ